MDKEYTLSYLPIFEEDIAKVRDYITFDLANPVAALRLIENKDDNEAGRKKTSK
jgi:hypothetical protein